MKTHGTLWVSQVAVLAGLFIGLFGGTLGLAHPAFAFAYCPEGQHFGCVHYNNDPHQPLYCNCFPNYVAVIPAVLPEDARAGSLADTKDGFFDSEKYKQCMNKCMDMNHSEPLCDIRCGGW